VNVVKQDDCSGSLKFICPEADLDCEGGINIELHPSETIIECFYVKNKGGLGSLLNWEITNHPTWGDQWNFNPQSGKNLRPEDGAVKVIVSFRSPDSIGNYQGEIKVSNKNNPSDYDTIPVYVRVIPHSRQNINSLFQVFLKSYSNLFPLINSLLCHFGLKLN